MQAVTQTIPNGVDVAIVEPTTKKRKKSGAAAGEPTTKKRTKKASAVVAEGGDQITSPAVIADEEKAEKKVKVSKKEIDKKLKHASLKEMEAFIIGLANSHPEAITQTFPSFKPAKMPIVPIANDPILQSCFHCRGREYYPLSNFHGVKICGHCYADIYKHDTLNKMKIQKYFYFSESEAQSMPHKIGSSYLGIYFKYKHGTILKAAKQKYGSLYSMVVKKRQPVLRDYLVL